MRSLSTARVRAAFLFLAAAFAAGAATAQNGALYNCASGRNYCDFRLSPDFKPDPLASTGLSGGPIRTDDCGNIDAAPDHVITLSQPFAYLRVYAVSSGDVTMVVQGPFGRVCSDDAIGLMPAVARQWPAGTYQVWVGDWQRAWSIERAHYYTLYVSGAAR